MMHHATLTLLAFLMVIVIPTTVSRGAPEVAPALPEGWCDLKQGSPTRTTGECICRRNCEGPRCRKEQGLSYYSYKECPTCQCVGVASGNSQSKTNPDPSLPAAVEAAQRESSKPESAASGSGKAKAPVRHYSQRVDTSSSDSNTNSSEDEDSVGLMVWLEDNWRLLFGGFITLVVVAVMAMLVLLSPQSSDTADPEKSPKSTPDSKSQPQASNASDDDDVSKKSKGSDGVISNELSDEVTFPLASDTDKKKD